VTNIYDFKEHKKAREEFQGVMAHATNYVEGQVPDISIEIDWATSELDHVEDTLEILMKELVMHENYKLALVSYLSGMEMAKRFIDGGNLNESDFWDWASKQKNDENDLQLEIDFVPDFKVDTDE
jgi:hypothetical protein